MLGCLGKSAKKTSPCWSKVTFLFFGGLHLFDGVRMPFGVTAANGFGFVGVFWRLGGFDLDGLSGKSALSNTLWKDIGWEAD